MAENKKKNNFTRNKRDFRKGKGLTYTVITQGVSNEVFSIFEDNYAELFKYAKKNGCKRPGKGDLLSRMIKKSGHISPEEFYS